MSSRIYMEYDEKLHEIPLDSNEMFRRTNNRQLSNQAFYCAESTYVYTPHRLSKEQKNFVLENMFELCANRIVGETEEDSLPIDVGLEKLWKKSIAHRKNGKLNYANYALQEGIKLMANFYENLSKTEINNRGR